jgi:hypothetical protein
MTMAEGTHLRCRQRVATLGCDCGGAGVQVVVRWRGNLLWMGAKMCLGKNCVEI